MATDPVVDGFSRLGQVDLRSNTLNSRLTNQAPRSSGAVTHISEKERTAQAERHVRKPRWEATPCSRRSGKFSSAADPVAWSDK